ncbi:MAG: hypothetical protein HY901_26805, partial [Deltaproteobacteria bacterium]|nr:hypothetical protein [Deltaproteobacteria bacterium]
ETHTVSLEPASLTLPPGGQGTLRAIVTPFPADGEVRFAWRNSARYGHLSNQPGLQDDFEGVLEQATYTAGEATGADTVRVEAFLVQGEQRESLGAAEATVTVGAGPVLEPTGPRVSVGEDIFFEVGDRPQLAPGATLRCRWTNTAAAGILWSPADANQEHPDDFTNYCGAARYKPLRPGSDQIAVEVLSDLGGHLAPGGWVPGEVTTLARLTTQVEVLWSGPYELTVEPQAALGLAPGESLTIEVGTSPEPIPGGVLEYSFELTGCGRLVGGVPGASENIRLSPQPRIVYEAPTDVLCRAGIAVDLRHTFPEEGERLIGANSTGVSVASTDAHPSLPVQVEERFYRTEGVEPGESFEILAFFTWTAFPGTSYWNVTPDWSGAVFPLYSAPEPPAWLGITDRVVLVMSDASRLNRDGQPLSPDEWAAEVDAARQTLLDEVDGWTLSVVGIP